MPKSTFKKQFKTLNWSQKIAFLSPVILLISAFLPWYSDQEDRYQSGEIYLGITGPLYLHGLLTVILAGTICYYLYQSLFQQRESLKTISIDKLMIFNGIGTFICLILAVSTFLHPQFGYNLTDKSLGIGLYLGILASASLILTGFLWKEETVPKIDTSDRLSRSLNDYLNQEIVRQTEEVREPISEIINQNGK